MDLQRTLQVEPLFDDFVRSAGGELVRDIVGASPKFDNADYLFREQRIILELKCLTEDFLANGGFMARLGAALGKAAGIESITEPGQYEIPITSKLASELRRVKEEPIRRVLKKANRQLKETAIALDMPNAARVVLLNNDGLLSMRSSEIVDRVAEVLGREFSGIDAFVYFTANFREHGPDGEPAQLWMPSTTTYAPESLAEDLRKLGMQWFAFLGPKVGGWTKPVIEQGRQQHPRRRRLASPVMHHGNVATAFAVPDDLSVMSNFDAAGERVFDMPAHCIIHPASISPHEAMKRRTGGWCYQTFEPQATENVLEQSVASQEDQAKQFDSDARVTYARQNVGNRHNAAPEPWLFRTIEYPRAKYADHTLFVEHSPGVVFWAVMMSRLGDDEYALRILRFIAKRLHFVVAHDADPTNATGVFEQYVTRGNVLREFRNLRSCEDSTEE